MRNSIPSGNRAPASDGALPAALVGPSEAAARARDEAERAAASRLPALIAVEPGCRPAEIAAWLHARTRRGHPLVVIDCADHEPLEIDRRLFGAPARAPMPSDLETLAPDAALLEAGDGTVFLDNIEELPAGAQRRLARALRDGEVRVAAHREPVPLGCRVVAATTRELQGEVRDGRFRQDLGRRLGGCRIAVPGLRHRPADLAAVVDRLMAGADLPRRPFTQPAITVLAALPWPRNIDELAGVLARVLVTAGPVVRQEDVLTHLPIDGAFSRPDLTTSLRDARRQFERDYIAAVLERHQWRMRDAARALGIERANLYRKTRQLGIRRAARQERS